MVRRIKQLRNNSKKFAKFLRSSKPILKPKISEMNKAEVNTNKMTDLINSNNEADNKNFISNKILETEKDAIASFNNQGEEQTTQATKVVKSFQKIAQNLDKLFTQEEKEELEFRFLINSSNGLMSIRSFWKVLGLEQIADTAFAKLFYQAASNFNDNKDPNKLQFMTKEKYFQFVAVFTKTKVLNENESYFIEGVNKNDNNPNSTFAQDVRLNFLYSLFDVDNNEEVNKIDFRNLISSFLEMILTCKFECAPIQEQINAILNINTSNGTSSTSQLMESVLDSYVEDAFTRSFTGETLTFDEWKKWLFEEIAGIQEILDFSATIVSSTNEK